MVVINVGVGLLLKMTTHIFYGLLPVNSRPTRKVKQKCITISFHLSLELLRHKTTKHLRGKSKSESIESQVASLRGQILQGLSRLGVFLMTG